MYKNTSTSKTGLSVLMSFGSFSLTTYLDAFSKIWRCFNKYSVCTFAVFLYLKPSNPLKLRIFSSVAHCGYDLGTEELAHLEMVAAIVHQLTRNMTIEQIKTSGYADYFVDHTAGIYPISASGVPFNAAAFAVKGDVIADLTEDLAAEQKARVTYDNILRFADDPDVRDPIKFLRAREVVHFQRFGEALRVAQDKLDAKNFYAINPQFDKPIM
jgi:spore coat protein JC